MSLFPEEFANAVFLSRSDDRELLGTFLNYGFELEGCHWPTLEHYFQGMKFENEVHREQVRTARTPQAARRIGRSKRRKLRPDWHQVREIIMTRGVYTRCRTYPVLAEALLATGERMLVENSAYDYHWGCGRDRRGYNHYGRVLMNVRAKLQEEQRQAQP